MSMMTILAPMPIFNGVIMQASKLREEIKDEMANLRFYKLKVISIATSIKLKIIILRLMKAGKK